VANIEKQINMYRHEIKYFISKRQSAELRLFLKRNMALDPNSDETGSYWIRSLYFDTIDNKDYYEKTIGHNNRNNYTNHNNCYIKILRIHDT